MNNRENMLAVLAGRKPDRIPLFCFSELMPRGGFERMLRNRGMGFMVHASPLAEEMPNVATTKSKSDVGEKTTYHTPAGDISIDNYMNTARISASMHTIKANSLIKNADDYEPLIYMINDTIYHVDMKEFRLKDIDLGDDGMLHVCLTLAQIYW